MQSFASSNVLSLILRARANRLVPAILALAGLFLVPTVTLAAAGGGGNSGGSNSVNKVEEDWEVDLGTPNTSLGSPQLTFLVSPTGNTTSYYAIFTVNQRDGAVGGLQLSLWNGSSKLTTTTFNNTSKLSSSGEKLQWTTQMALSGNTLTVTVSETHGNSNAWGNFTLSASTSTTLSDLNSYDITGTVSADNSGVDFGNARVSKILLQAIRTYTGTGNNTKTTSQLGSAKTVYSYP